jgi:asparagine synthase (glutamine-hydrolysing)
MCGIAGWIAKPGIAIDPKRLTAMRHALTHRGPDGGAEHIAGPVALAHARLAIIDVAGGQQPLVRGQHALVGNGEIYNYIELIADNHLTHLPTGSDFEPVIALARDYGVAAFRDLRGMYGLAYSDSEDLWLVRDPFGIKPLYIAQTDEGLAFASEPRALIAGGFAGKAVDTDVVAELLHLNYALGSVWSGVERMQPGERRHARAGHTVDCVRTPALPKPDAAPKTLAAAVERFDAVMTDAVKVHMRSDVPYGLFLSGGVDSSVIASITARLADQPVTTFVCGFDAPGARDERAKAQRVAEALKLDVHAVTMTEADFWRLLPIAAWAFDDPTSDPACLPTLRLAEAAKGHLKVVLTGEGGDELFAGYGRYRKALRPWWLGGRAAEPHGAFAACPAVLRTPGAEVLERWRTVAHHDTHTDPLMHAQAADIATWLPADLLLKADRCLMAHGLEGRTPFLDPSVAAFATSLPRAMKVRGRIGKQVPRHWLAQHRPEAEPFARKQGFTVPVYDWLKPQAARLGPLLAANAHIAAVAHPDLVALLLRDLRPEHAQAAYNLVFYALWSAVQVEGRTGDVEALLV